MTKTLELLCHTIIMMSLAACVQRPSQGIPPSRWSFREFTLIRGVVMCAPCSLEQAQSRYPEAEGLYEFSSVQGPLVFRVDWVSDAVRWRQLTLGSRLAVRAASDVLQQLIAPEHLRRPMELNSILRDERTLDIGSINITKED